ncbi:MAG: glutathione S-transferase family protein [Pseudomonadales bacterium]|nr:glutathione S-transferase family protein [Pseudomonadales bacterium]MBO6597129.1 glutathione S-transferase family protein [Pseudomonadales bacterium]MBO6823684.1 glutathione S-transferase family protein [Pseudomonadales bacterium]
MADIRIFSYLPNPRVWKSLIAAELCNVDVEVIGDKPAALGSWLWDFNAHQLSEGERSDDSPYARKSRRGFNGTLFKTDAFLEAHPFGTVPAAFSSDGNVGVFESNSILRAVVRTSAEDHGLYGYDHQSASRVDSFLDADLVFAREAQVYLLAADNMDQATAERMAAAYEFFLNGLEQALTTSHYIAGDELTIADIGICCDVFQFLRERLLASKLASNGFTPISADLEVQYPQVTQHLRQLSTRPVFNQYLGRELHRTLGP